MTTTSIENHTLERLIDAWDTTVLPKHHDGAMQEWMESLRHEFMTCKQNAMNELTNDQLHDIWLKTSLEEWDFARAVIAADRALQNNAWRKAIDDARLSLMLDITAPDANPAASVKELVAWANELALNPAISSDAQALIDRGLAMQAERHAEELLAYEVTVGNLRAEPALTCDFCGCDTQDPWHGSTATNRHVHACDMCRPKLAQPQGEPVAAAGEDLAIYQSIADNYFKSIRPAHTEAEVQELLDSTEGRHEVTIRRILGVPA